MPNLRRLEIWDVKSLCASDVQVLAKLTSLRHLVLRTSIFSSYEELSSFDFTPVLANLLHLQTLEAVRFRP
jgi:hypothetical protein